MKRDNYEIWMWLKEVYIIKLLGFILGSISCVPFNMNYEHKEMVILHQLWDGCFFFKQLGLGNGEIGKEL